MPDTFNFRGLVKAPATRDGVIFLFGKIAEELNVRVEEMRAAFPSCLARRYTGSGWEKVKIEFECRSADFKKKGLDPAGCDILVCWENNWPDCPLEVIEMEDRLAELSDRPVVPPDADFEDGLNRLFDRLKVNDNIRHLMTSIDRQLRDIDERIWAKATDEYVVYYSPQRPFLYAYPKPKLINFQLYSGDESIEGVRYYQADNASKTWGYINMDYGSIQTTLNAIKESFRMAKEAVKGNERMEHFNGEMGNSTKNQT